MEKNKKNVPKIRFKGFTEEWVEESLGDSATIVGGGTPSTNIKEYWNGDIDWYSPAEIGDKIFVGASLRKITELGLKNSSAQILPVGTVLFSSRAGIGNTAILIKDGATNQGFQSIVPDKNKLDTYFIFSRTNELKRYGEINGAGSTFIEISGKQMACMPIFNPKLAEQAQIGNYFQNIDKLIEAKQSRIDKLKNIKKACLEKMFPKKGATTPEIRFKGFSGEWEENTIGEASFVYDGTHQTPKYTNSGIMFLSVENIKSLKSNKFISLNDYKQNFKTYPENGDVLMTRIGDIGTANVVETDQPIAYYVSLALLKKKELYPYFFKELIHSNEVQNRLWHRTLHIAFPKKINKNEIEKVEITHPFNFEEQQQIGDFLKNLDKLISQNEQQLTKLKNIKKACLEKMFVNKEDVL